VAVARLRGGGEVAGGRDVHALALDRLDEIGGDVSLSQLCFERGEIAKRHPGRFDQLAEALAEHICAVHRQCACGEAVEACRSVEDAVARGGPAGELDRRLVGFRAGRAEVDVLQPVAHALLQLARQKSAQHRRFKLHQA
jgi:hypothetical protein